MTAIGLALALCGASVTLDAQPIYRIQFHETVAQGDSDFSQDDADAYVELFNADNRDELRQCAVLNRVTGLGSTGVFLPKGSVNIPPLLQARVPNAINVFFVGDIEDGACTLAGGPDENGATYIYFDRDCADGELIAALEDALLVGAQYYPNSCTPIGEVDVVRVRARRRLKNGSPTFAVERVATSSVEADNPVEISEEVTQESDDWVVRTFEFAGSAPADRYRVRFTNDARDRDLDVDYLELNGVRYESEAATTYTTGTWTPDNACAPGFKQRETLHCNGYFQYDVAAESIQSRDFDPATAATVFLADGASGLTAVRLGDLAGADDGAPLTLALFDATGRRVLAHVFAGAPAPEYTLDVGALAPGYYVLRQERGSASASEGVVLR